MGGWAGHQVMISPNDEGRQKLIANNAWPQANPDKVVSLASAWQKGLQAGQGLEVEWFAFNNNVRLSPNSPDRARYVDMAKALKMHGILGFRGMGWSGERESERWVEVAKKGGKSIRDSFFEGMFTRTGFGDWAWPASIVRIKGTSDCRNEGFGALTDTDSGSDADGWETKIDVYQPPGAP